MIHCGASEKMDIFGTSHFVNYGEVVLSSEFTCIMERRPQTECALFMERCFLFIHSVLYQRFYSMYVYVYTVREH